MRTDQEYSVVTLDLSPGHVKTVTVVQDRGRSRGFAFVEMHDRQAAQQAIAELNLQHLAGRAITVYERSTKNIDMHE